MPRPRPGQRPDVCLSHPGGRHERQHQRREPTDRGDGPLSRSRSRGRRFVKLSGAGNDFIAVLGDDGPPPTAGEIVTVCRRRLSLGADGVLYLERTGATAARLAYFNADGSRGDLCLNGSRCAVRLAVGLGWISAEETLALSTDAGKLRGRLLDDESATTTLPDGLVGTPRPQILQFDHLDAWPGPATLEATFVMVGVPHLVVDLAALGGSGGARALQELELATLGPTLRHHAALGPAGANVDVVTLDEGRLHLRSWERGVETETLACGTGALAAVRALAPSRAVVTVATAGGHELTVELADGAASTHGAPDDERVARLSGDARWVAEGELAAGAFGAGPRSERISGLGTRSSGSTTS
ncbi:MAG: diaminopimelate epimerase [Acidobacteriota bacterium]